MSPFDTTGQKRTNWQPKRHFSQHAYSSKHYAPKQDDPKPKTFWNKLKSKLKISK